ncbi:thiol reductant ABC exporter subunit CydD [Allostreptomyces psammosilenae]|uniref:ATP-binding cassette subfamily C protein CydCD n=1 Tax=Allostreptomyces psammosilenae TaxID=1892865 RepID=A0A852ZV23_9ACTN|nr:thiol reductant ABC exporter subunit CydD [Allostreptomyces psammosilenae]NYI05457.1 ATP-binding cassette subfamily C protein CydCD [Allostreptomyces psammosilenae]
MKPIDPRLLRHAPAGRAFIAGTFLLGVVDAGLVLLQAALVAGVVTDAFQRGLGAADLTRPLLALAGLAVARAAVSWLTEVSADRSSARVKSQLRAELLRRAVELGPGAPGTPAPAELATLAVRGIDALDGYFARYLPQLALAVVVPAAVLLRVVTADWLSAVTIACTLPLIPVFMILIGMATQRTMDRQWNVLSRLSGHFLDVVVGLPTLKVFGRAKRQAEAIRQITDDYRRATMRTLRIAFLSSFALELLATLSVALVAVGIGLRLVHGELDLYTGLLVLVLAPEAYTPLRQVGAEYHASVEGLSAAERAFQVLEAPTPRRGTRPAPERPGALHLRDVTVRHPGRATPALDGVTLTVPAGGSVALTGPSGAGKTTLLRTLLGFTTPEHGRITVQPGTRGPAGAIDPAGATDLADLDPDSWRSRIAWVPQHPVLFAGTIAENVRLARPDADDAAVRQALRAAGAWDFVATLPGAEQATLGEGGAGLSAGQRQRIAVARAFLADRPVLLLDEPTAHLDGRTEADLVAALRRLAAGRTTIVVAHRPALLALADRVVTLGGPAEGPAEGSADGPTAGIAADSAAGRQTAAPVGQPAADPTRTLASAAAPVAPADSDTPLVPATPSDTATSPAAPALRPTDPTGSNTESNRPTRRLRALAAPLRGRLALTTLFGALALACAVGLMGVSGWLISRASEQPPVLYLMMAVTSVRAFGIGRSVFRYVERLTGHDATFRILAGLRADVFRRLERIAPAGLPGFRGGDLLSRFVADVDGLQDHFLRWLLPARAAAVVALATCLGLGLVLPEAGLLLAVGLAVAGIAVPLLATAVAGRTERRIAPARGALSTAVLDLLTGLEELVVAGAAPRRLATVAEHDRALTRLAARSAGTRGLGAGLATAARGLTLAGCAALGTAAVAAGRLDGVMLAVVVLTPLAAFETVAGMPAAAQARQRARRSAERVFEIADVPAPVREPDRPKPAPADPHPIRVEGLTVRRDGRPEPALRGLDLELDRRGRRVAVVGPSGAGKTTLAWALLRFLEPAQGRITLAGTDVTELDGDAVRRLIGLCAQDAHIFDSDLRENLRLARPGADDAELRRALAGARLLDWVDTLPDGLDTLVGQGGARLSGGQRQRLALARVLLADFPVVLLDEPAEHLPTSTADALTADLLDATAAAGRTTVLVTHRLAGLVREDGTARVDEIVVLDAGVVVQRGRWEDLVRVEGPLRSAWLRERGEGAEGAEAVVGAGETGESVGSAQPMESVESAGSAQPMESVESVEPAGSVA